MSLYFQTLDMPVLNDDGSWDGDPSNPRYFTVSSWLVDYAPAAGEMHWDDAQLYSLGDEALANRIADQLAAHEGAGAFVKAISWFRSCGGFRCH